MFPTPEDASERRDAVVTGVLQDVSDRLTSSVQNDPFSPGHRVEVVRGENDKAILCLEKALAIYPDNTQARELEFLSRL